MRAAGACRSRPDRLARYFYHGVSELDLVQRAPEDLAGAALAEFEPRHARARAAVSLVRVFNPEPARDGFASSHTVHHGHHGRHAVPGRLARHRLHRRAASRCTCSRIRCSRSCATGTGAWKASTSRTRRPARSSNPGSSSRSTASLTRGASPRSRRASDSALGDVRASDRRLARMRGKALDAAAELGRCACRAARRARCARRRRCSSGWRTTTSRSSATANIACGAGSRQDWLRAGRALRPRRHARPRRLQAQDHRAGRRDARIRALSGAADHHEGEFDLDRAPVDLPRLCRRQHVRRERQCHGRAALHRPSGPRPRTAGAPARFRCCATRCSASSTTSA